MKTDTEAGVTVPHSTKPRRRPDASSSRGRGLAPMALAASAEAQPTPCPWTCSLQDVETAHSPLWKPPQDTRTGLVQKHARPH